MEASWGRDIGWDGTPLHQVGLLDGTQEPSNTALMERRSLGDTEMVTGIPRCSTDTWHGGYQDS